MSNAQAKTASPMDKLQLRKLLEKDPKGHLGATAVKTLYDVVLGVGVGGFAGAVVGKHSFWPGLIITGLGYYYDTRIMQAVGMGMMASSHLLAPNEKSVRTKEGFDKTAELQDAKLRIQKFGQSLLERTYGDKLIGLFKRKSQDQQTNSTADPNIETPPETAPVVNGLGEPDYSQLDKIGQQIVSSAVAYQSANPQVGEIGFHNVPVNGMDEEHVDPDMW